MSRFFPGFKANAGLLSFMLGVACLVAVISASMARIVIERWRGVWQDWFGLAIALYAAWFASSWGLFVWRLATSREDLDEPDAAPAAASPLMPESRFSVATTPDEIRVEDPYGQVAAVAIADLHEIRIVTDDSGPLAADLWWWLHRKDGSVVRFPGGSSGEQEFLAFTEYLPEFDFEAALSALSSTTHAVFVCWRAPTAD